MAPPIIAPARCARRRPRYTSTSCHCPATAPTSCRSRRSGAGSARMSPIITAIPPPKISAGGWLLSRPVSIRTPTPLPTASGSKITSTLMKKNYASQSRRGLAPRTGDFDVGLVDVPAPAGLAGAPLAQALGQQRRQLGLPVTHRLVGEHDAADQEHLGQVAQAQL